MFSPRLKFVLTFLFLSFSLFAHAQDDEDSDVKKMTDTFFFYGKLESLQPIVLKKYTEPNRIPEKARIVMLKAGNYESGDPNKYGKITFTVDDNGLLDNWATIDHISKDIDYNEGDHVDLLFEHGILKQQINKYVNGGIVQQYILRDSITLLDNGHSLPYRTIDLRKKAGENAITTYYTNYFVKGLTPYTIISCIDDEVNHSTKEFIYKKHTSQIRYINLTNKDTGKQSILNDKGEPMSPSEATISGLFINDLQVKEYAGDSIRLLQIPPFTELPPAQADLAIGKLFICPIPKTLVIPHFEGGENAMKQYLANTFSLPQMTYKKNQHDCVAVMFSIKKDGSVTDVHVIKTDNSILGDKAAAAISSMPKWICTDALKTQDWQFVLLIPTNML